MLALVTALSSYLDFFADYFSTEYILLALGSACIIVISAYVVFRLSWSSRVRSLALLGMMVTSASAWTFSLSSLAFCVMLVGVYWKSQAQAVSLAAELALTFTFVISPIAILVLKRRAVKSAYPFFSKIDRELGGYKEESPLVSKRRIRTLFSVLRDRIPDLAGVQLGLFPRGTFGVPVSAAMTLKGENIVAVSEEATRILDDEELESVLAHEMGHLKHRDSLLKLLATSYKFAFPFDPLSRPIEAAIYREKELEADEFSAKSTGNPASLASALVKIYELSKQSNQFLLSTSSRSPHALAISMISTKSPDRASLLSKQPTLKLRVRRLLELASEAGQTP